MFHLESRSSEEQKQFYKKCTKAFTKTNLLEIKRIFIMVGRRVRLLQITYKIDPRLEPVPLSPESYNNVT